MKSIKDILNSLKQVASNVGSSIGTSVNTSLNDDKGWFRGGNFTPVQQVQSIGQSQPIQNIKMWSNPQIRQEFNTNVIKPKISSMMGEQQKGLFPTLPPVPSTGSTGNKILDRFADVSVQGTRAAFNTIPNTLNSIIKSRIYNQDTKQVLPMAMWNTNIPKEQSDFLMKGRYPQQFGLTKEEGQKIRSTPEWKAIEKQNIENLTSYAAIMSTNLGKGEKFDANAIQANFERMFGKGNNGSQLAVSNAVKPSLTSSVVSLNVPKTINPEVLSQGAKNSLLNNPQNVLNKPNRLQGEGVSFKEAETGLAENGKYLTDRIIIGKNDNGDIVLKDGTHLLEAYRQKGLQIPPDKIKLEDGVKMTDFSTQPIKTGGDVNVWRSETGMDKNGVKLAGGGGTSFSVSKDLASQYGDAKPYKLIRQPKLVDISKLQPENQGGIIPYNIWQKIEQTGGARGTEMERFLKTKGFDGYKSGDEMVLLNKELAKSVEPIKTGGDVNVSPTIPQGKIKIKNIPLEQPTGPTLKLNSNKLPWEEKGFNFGEAIYGGNKPPKPPVNNFTQQTGEEATNAINFADMKANEDKGTFKNIFAEWIGKKESARTKATVEAQSFIKVPGKESDIIKAVENPKIKVSGEQEQYILQLRQTYDKLFKEAKDNGVDMGYLENYLTHEWNKPISQVKLDYKNAKQKFGFSNERSIPTYEEGIKMGLTPKYSNPAQILESYTRRLNETLANVELFKNLKNEGLIVGGSKVTGDPNFAPINAPGFPKATFQLGDGQKIISNWYAPKDIANQINRQFTPQDTGSLGNILKVGSKASGIVQDITLSGGLPKTPLNAWTIAQTTKEILSGRVISPITSFVRSLSGEASNKFFSDNSKQIIKMQERNIPISTTFNTENLIDKGTVKNIFGEGIGNNWNKLVNEPTFKRFMPQLEINLFNDIEKSLLKSGIGEKEAADQAAKAVKNFYGIVGSDVLANRNQLTKDAVSTLFFAPRYRESMINFWVNNVKALKDPLSKENITNSKFVVGAVLAYLGMNAINKSNTGNNMWENPPGKEDKMLIKTKDGYVGVPFLSSIATMPRAALKLGKHLVTGNIQEVPNDIKATLASSIRPAVDVFTNEDYFGGQIYDPSAKNKFADIGLYLAGQYNHPYIRETMNTVAQNLSPEVKSKLGLSKNAVPGYQTFSKAMELPFRFYNNKVGVTGQDALASSWYYASKDEAAKELDSNQKQIYETLMAKRPDDISQAANTQSEMAEALLLLSNPAVLRAKAKTAIDTSLKTGESLDPFYSLTKEQQQVVLTLKTFYPGDKQKSTMQTSNIEWLKPYWTARSAYFDELTKKGVIAAQEPSEEYASPEMQKKLDYYYTLPYGTGARTQFINQNPDLVEYWDKKAAITNAKRAELGLEPLAGFTKYASSKAAKKISKLKILKPKKIASMKIKKAKVPKLSFKFKSPKKSSIKTIALKKPKLKTLKLKQIKV